MKFDEIDSMEMKTGLNIRDAIGVTPDMMGPYEHSDRHPKTPDCEDKKSTHYFMFHMTQEEFEKMYVAKAEKPFEFNMIRKK